MIEIRQTPEFARWLSKLKDSTSKTRILDRLERLELGNFGDHKSLGVNLFKLRFTFGPGYRVYCSRHGDKLILLLIGGDKSSQTRDIVKAREILKGLI